MRNPTTVSVLNEHKNFLGGADVATVAAQTFKTMLPAEIRPDGDNKVVTMTAALQEFLLAAKANGLADSTLTWYRSLLGRLIRELGESFPTTHDLRQYTVVLRDTSHIQ